MRSNDSPRISVLMPMRNAGAYLRAAIDSVLSQSHASLELIVVDDGSTDGSGDVVRAIGEPRICLLDGPRSGIAACLNLALSRAQGDILMRCDADDLYPDGRVRTQVDWLVGHPQHDAVCGPFSTIDRRGMPVSNLGSWPSEVLPDASARLLDRSLGTTLCSFAIRREAVDRVGGFRSFFETAEDIDFMLRLAQRASIAFLPANTYHYRLHDSSVTHRQASLRRVYFENAAYAMAVERKQTGSDSLMRGQVPVVSAGDEGAGAQSADSHVAALLVGEAWQRHARGDTAGARACAWRALCADMRSWAAWKALALVWLRRATSGTAPR